MRALRYAVNVQGFVLQMKEQVAKTAVHWFLKELSVIYFDIRKFKRYFKRIIRMQIRFKSRKQIFKNMMTAQSEILLHIIDTKIKMEI